LSFLRLSDAPPPLRELLDVEEDGSWRAWRSNASAIGRFAGRDAGGRGVLEAARAATASGPPPTSGAAGVLDDAVDELTIDGSTVEVAHGHIPAGPWGEALEAARDLVTDAPNHPVAAIALDVREPGLLRLVHRGSEPLEVELGSGRFDAMAYDTDGMPTASTFGPIDLGQVTARSGWTADLAVEPMVPPPGGRLDVEVSFVADDDGVYVPVSLSSSWSAPPVD
jgi:hypothetical protein